MTDPKAEKMYTYLRGFAEGNRMMKNTLAALPLSRKLHKTQMRKDGKPYIYHPLVIACYAISLGLTEDVLIATILLHDVVEDCGVALDTLPVEDAVKHGVQYMTVKALPNDKNKWETKRRYYAQLLEDRTAFVVKALDRQHNLADMAGVFSPDKIAKNVYETEELLLPLFREAKEKWPDMTNLLFVLKANLRQINGMLKTIYAAEYVEFKRTTEGL